MSTTDTLVLPLGGLTAKRWLKDDHNVNWLCKRFDHLHDDGEDHFTVVVAQNHTTVKCTRL